MNAWQASRPSFVRRHPWGRIAPPIRTVLPEGFVCLYWERSWHRRPAEGIRSAVALESKYQIEGPFPPVLEFAALFSLQQIKSQSLNEGMVLYNS